MSGIESARWKAVRGRAAAARFVYGVRSTGIYCLASCPSRRPARRQVLFFEDPAAAERAGFRACLRCRPGEAGRPGRAVEAVRLACRLIEQSPVPPGLRELAVRVGMSPFHFHRTFTRTLGVTPKQYADERRAARARRSLREARTVTEAIYDAGYSSGSRFYETSTHRLGMTPRAYRAGAPGAEIRYLVARCFLGRLLVAATPRGICRVMLGGSATELVAGLRREHPGARIRKADPELSGWVKALLRQLDGGPPASDLPVDVKATAFQRRVWDALRRIPAGRTRSYSALARFLGLPRGARAVGNACAANPVALIVPCHRAVREDGGLGGYAWGVTRKRALLKREARRAPRRGATAR